MVIQIWILTVLVCLTLAMGLTEETLSTSTSSTDTEDQLSDEKRLMRMLQQRYLRLGKDGRPVRNSTRPVNVNFALGLIKMELHEKQNTLSLSVWSRFQWQDEYLTWDPDSYGGITSAKISNDKIWLPDVMLYNTANAEESTRIVKVIVTSEGYVNYYPHKLFKSACAIDVTHYPFDNQTCYLWFGSWTHTVNELDVDFAIPGGIDLGTFNDIFKDSSEWDIFNTSAEKKIMPEEAPHPSQQFAILSFTIQLKRKVMFSTLILTMPAVFMSFLTLLEFWLPPEHADKNALGLTIFGSLLLLLLILVEAAPPTASAIPLLGLYYSFTTVIVIVSIFLSSLVVKIGRKGDERDRPPVWLRVIFFDCLGKALCITCKRPSTCCGYLGRGDRDLVYSDESIEKESSGNHNSNTLKLNHAREDFDDHRGNRMIVSLSNVELQLVRLYDLLHNSINRKNDFEHRKFVKNEIDFEWRQIGIILDRLFFIIYLVIIIISTIVLFPRSIVQLESTFW